MVLKAVSKHFNTFIKMAYFGLMLLHGYIRGEWSWVKVYFWWVGLDGHSLWVGRGRWE